MQPNFPQRPPAPIQGPAGPAAPGGGGGPLAQIKQAILGDPGFLMQLIQALMKVSQSAGGGQGQQPPAGPPPGPGGPPMGPGGM